jgi:hypothetical protein
MKGEKMKKTIVLVLVTMLLIFTLVGTPILAKDPDKGSQGGPFKEVWEAINDGISALQEHIDDIQSHTGNSETPILGVWESRESFEIYDADTDGFVVASLEVDNGEQCNTLWVEVVEVWDEHGTPPKIVEHGLRGDVLSITVPVPKGYSWKVSTGSFPLPICKSKMTIYWVSLGN